MNTEVLKVQNLLNDNGANLVADGVLGPMSVAAIKQFQLVNNLLPDGRISSELIQSLMQKSVASSNSGQTSFFKTAVNFMGENKKPLIILGSISIFGYGVWFIKKNILSRKKV